MSKHTFILNIKLGLCRQNSESIIYLIGPTNRNLVSYWLYILVWILHKL